MNHISFFFCKLKRLLKKSVVTSAEKVMLLMFFFNTSGAVVKFNKLLVKSDFFEEDKSNAFFEMPLNTKSQLIEDFVKVVPEDSFKFQIEFYCRRNDPRFCLMFDKKGNVAGTQISFLKADTNNAKPEELGIIKDLNFVETNFFGMPAYSSRVYFTNPELLTEKGMQISEEVGKDGVWLYLDSELVMIPREESLLKSEDFFKQYCIPEFGVPHVHKSHLDEECNNLYVVYFSYENGVMVSYGIGFTSKPSKLEVDWYQKPFGKPLEDLEEHYSACYLKLARKYGVVALNVYLVDNPRNISCPK